MEQLLRRANAENQIRASIYSSESLDARIESVLRQDSLTFRSKHNRARDETGMRSVTGAVSLETKRNY